VKIVTNGEGSLRSRRCQNGTRRNALSSGMLTTRFLFPKFFPKKIWPKNWGGSSNRKFREWFVCGSGPAPPRPPFVQMKNTPGGPSRGADFQARHSARDRSLGRSIGGWLPVSCPCDATGPAPPGRLHANAADRCDLARSASESSPRVDRLANAHFC
jgi:hypothetical protein